MTDLEIKGFIEDVRNDIFNGPEKGYSLFIKKWSQIDEDSKSVIRQFVIEFCLERIGITEEFHPGFPSRGFTNLEVRIACTKMYKYLENELLGKANSPKLELGKGISVKDITTVFKLLKDAGYIKNTSSEIANMILNSFKVKSNSTIKTYLENPKELFHASSKFKKKIASLQLKEDGE